MTNETPEHPNAPFSEHENTLGFVDSFGTDAISGWVVNFDNLNLGVTLDLIVNDVPIARTKTFGQREDIVRIYKARGDHLFTFDSGGIADGLLVTPEELLIAAQSLEKAIEKKISGALRIAIVPSGATTPLNIVESAETSLSSEENLRGFSESLFNIAIERLFPAPLELCDFERLANLLNLSHAVLAAAMLQTREVEVRNLLPMLCGDPLDDFALRLYELTDLRYCSVQNGWRPATVLAELKMAIEEERWVAFCPFLTERDYLRSGLPSLREWIKLFGNPKASIVGMDLDRFMPRLYRETANELNCENELLDFIRSRGNKAALSHVFVDQWYWLQFHDIRDLAQVGERGSNIWEDIVLEPFVKKDNISLFFDLSVFNHRYENEPQSRNFQKLAKEAHPLDKFLSQKSVVVSPHDHVLPSALKYCFLNSKIEDCLPEKVTPRDVIKALEIALLGSRPKPLNVKVSICILNFNKPTFSVLSAIAAALNCGPDAEVIVLDNGSEPKDHDIMLHYFRKYQNIRLIRTRWNLLFGEGNNVAFDEAKGSYIVFLNNDAFVGASTIDKMVAVLERDESISASGVTFLFPDLRIQEAGGLVSDCGQTIQQIKHLPFADYMAVANNLDERDTDYISSACFCVRRGVLKEIGGYDYLFEPLYFEDTDLCTRIRRAGGRIVHIPDEFVIHFENATNREFLGSDFNRQIDSNREAFRKRWFGSGRHYNPRKGLKKFFNALDPARKNAVIFSPYNVGLGGGERYILSVAATLSESHNLYFAVPNHVSRTRIAFSAMDLGVKFSDETVILPITMDDITSIHEIDIMITMGNEVVPPLMLSGSIRVHHCQFPFPGHHQDRWQVGRLRAVDAMMVNSRYTANHARRALETYGVEIPIEITYAPVRDFVEENCWKKTRIFDAGELRLLNVGRFEPDGHSKRQDVVLDIFERVEKRIKNSSLTLLGGFQPSERRSKYVTQLRDRASTLPVEFLFNETRDALERRYIESDIYVHACGFGQPAAAPEKQEHFGIAVVEAMMAGAIPIVYDGGGPADIVREAGVGFVYSQVDEAVRQICGLARQPAPYLRELSARAQAAARKYADSVFQARCRRFIEKLNASRENGVARFEPAKRQGCI